MAVNYLTSVPKLLGRENYADWAFAVENVFVLEGLTKCLDSSASGEKDANQISKAKAKLILTLDSSLFIHVKECKTAAEVWSSLKKLYEDTGVASKIGLLRRLISLRLDNCESMESYINQITDISQKLDRCGFKLTQEFIGSLMLAGLTEKFEPMVIAIEHAGVDITADSIKSRLLDMHIGGVDECRTAVGAFAAKGKKVGNKYKSSTASSSSTDKNNKSEVTCFKCHRLGHFRNQCPELKKQKSAKDFIALSAVFMSGQFSISDWYVDSGCSSHLTGRKDWLKNINKNFSIKNITVANNEKLIVESAGDVDIMLNVKDINHSATIYNALYVPGLMTNLLSVSELIKNNKKVIFHSSGCDIYDSEDQLIATADLIDKVYKLNVGKSVSNLVAGLAVSGQTWHRRFGHLNYKDLSKMKNGLVNGLECKDALVKEDLCEVCCEGKQARLSFGKGTRATSTLEIVHADLCGPMEVNSLGGSRYFMLLEDDFTKMLFVYFLKSKDQAYEKFIV